MKQFVRNLSFLIFIFICFEANATHVLGGEIQYSYRSKDSVDLTVIMYRDCKGISMPPISIDIVGVGCSYSASTGNINYSSCSDVTPVCKKSCSKCDRNSCNAYGYPNGANAGCTFPYGIEKLVYNTTVDLSSTNCCKIRFELSLSARNGSITTCCANENYYTYAEMDRCKASQNTSPIYNSNPVAMMCVGNCLAMNMGGSDTTDNDSISYHMAAALSGYGSSCSYQGSYTYQYPLYYDGFPTTKYFNSSTCKGFSIDSTTGILNFKPMQQQVAVVAVDIKEWRRDTSNKMVQIGLTRRDIEFIVVSNCTNKPPYLPGATISACAGDLVCFTGIKSSDPDKKDTVRLSWNKGIPKGNFTPKFNGSGKQLFDFCWQTDSSDRSSTPYYFTVTATDDACPLQGTYSRTYSVLVNSGTKPSATHQISYLGCNKLKLESLSSNASSQDTFIYTWTVSGKKYIAKDTIVNYIYDSILVVKLEVSNKNCSVWYYDTLFNLPKTLNLDLGSDIYLCQADTVSLKAKASSGSPPYNYLWQTGNSGDTLDNYTIIANANKQVVCKLSDSLGCEAYDTVNIYIDGLPKLSLGPDTLICGSDSIILNLTNNGYIKTFRWVDLANNNIIDSVQDIIIKKTSHIVCSVTDTLGCKNTDTISIIFGPKVTVNTNHLYTQCPDDTIIFTASGADSLVWINMNNGNIIYTGSSFKKSFTENSNTEILLHSFKTDSGITCDSYDTISVVAFPKPTITLTQLNDTIYVNSSLPVIQYNWERNNAFIDSTQLPYLHITQTGTYKVEVIDSNGCIDSSQSIVVSSLNTNISNIVNSNNFKISPNPSTGIYNIESTQAIDDLTIYDLMGRKVYNNSANKNIIDLTSQPEGIYLLQINKNIWVRLSKQ